MHNASPTEIVVVEDHPEHLDYLATLLRRAGYAVAPFASATEALAHLAATPARLVITDVFMPDMDGFEVLLSIRRTAPATKVIAISGSTRDGFFLKAMRDLGADASFTKPLEVEPFLGAVAALAGPAQRAKCAGA